MKGYVAKKGNRFYAVIYDGLDPVTGRERRIWHPTGTDRAEAELLATELAADVNGRNDDVRALSFGAYLTTRWLPGKRLVVAASTWDGYRRKIDHHILPSLGRTARSAASDPNTSKPSTTRCCTPPTAASRSHPRPSSRYISSSGVHSPTLSAKGSRHAGVALVADAPRLRSIPKVEQKAWTAQQLQAFLRCAAGHRLFPALWPAAMTGVRRSELLGLRWDDIDLEAATMSINRGLVAVAYELHESRGKTRNSRRRIDLDPTTVNILDAWRGWQETERAAVGTDNGWVFTDADSGPIHPHAISQTFEAIVARAGVPSIRFHDVRHTHATLLIKAGVPVKVVSERLGHATPAFTIDTYQHVLPGMQADAARVFEQLIAPAASTDPARLKRRRKTA